MKIGVVPMLDRSWGGMYQYSITFVEALGRLGLDDEIVLFASSGDPLPEELGVSPFRTIALPGFDRIGVLRRVAGRVLSPALISRMARSLRSLRGGRTEEGRARLLAEDSRPAEWFSAFDLDLLVFTVDDEISFQAGTPYIVAIHDLQHRIRPDLPEFSAESDWERREYRMRNAIARATVVLVDSQVGKEDVLHYYGDTGIDPEAVMPLPFVPAHYLDAIPGEDDVRRVRARYALPGGYLFYPAQFWPHKNHSRIVEALGILASEGHRPHLAFAGSKTGRLRQDTFDDAMQVARKLGVRDQVHYLGYVPDADMPGLYAGAAALVMPTFFGPTNIPVLEAWHFGCPVITSDLRGIREQVGDAGLLVDPGSPESIAHAIRRVVTDEAERESLVEKGHRRLASYTRDDFDKRLGEVIAEAKRRVVTSG